MTCRFVAWIVWLAAACLVIAADKSRPLNTVALSIASLENPFYVALVKGAEAQARGINPAVKLTTLVNEYSPDRQISQIRQLIALRVDLILLTAADGHKVGAAIAAARAAGIIVVAMDVEADGADAYVRTDSRQAGELACAYLANALKGRGKLIMQNGPQVSSVIDRIAGCHDALRNHPGIKVLSDADDGKGSRWGGMQLMLAHLKRFPSIDAVFAINDRQAIGADMAARRMGKHRLLIASVDGAPDIEQALRSDSLIQASASQNPYLMATQAVLLGNELLQGRRPAKTTVLLPTSLVTRDNIMQYRGWDQASH